jgi:hypothetical protein
MLAHLLASAVRSLAVTVVLGCILIYATGGLDSPNARGMVGVTAVCFFLFWITFFFMFGPRVPKRRSGERNGDPDDAAHLAFRVRRRRENDDDASHDGDGGAGGDSGGGGGD